MQKNRGDKSHRVIVALLEIAKLGGGPFWPSSLFRLAKSPV